MNMIKYAWSRCVRARDLRARAWYLTVLLLCIMIDFLELVDPSKEDMYE